MYLIYSRGDASPHAQRISFFFWNLNTRVTLKNLLMSHKPVLIFLVEPMITFSQVHPWFWQSIGVTKYCINDGGSLMSNLWVFWGRDINPTVIFVSAQCIPMEFSFQQSTTVCIVAVYASTYYMNRRKLWADLTHLQGCFQGPWLFIGDYNAVLGAHEKCGRRPPPSFFMYNFFAMNKC